MTITKSEKNLTSVKILVAEAIVIFIGIALITNYDTCRSSIIHSLNLCSETLIPSLFPFMFLASFISDMGFPHKPSGLFSRVTHMLSGLPPCSFTVFLLSIFGGYPVGARMIRELCENKSITYNQASRMLLFCFNPSPAFAVSAIGVSIFSSRKTGIIVYSSVVISNIIISLLSRCLDDKKEAEAPEKNDFQFSSTFIKAGNDAAFGMIKICSYVILFSAFISLMGAFIENPVILNFVYGFSEVTLGCEALSRLDNIPLIAGIVAWGGIAVHFQIMDCIKATKTDLRLFFTSRILSGALSVIVCDLLLKRFPVQVSAIQQNTSVSVMTNEVSFPVSIAMLITCFLFLVGDYTVNNRIKKHKNIETEGII